MIERQLPAVLPIVLYNGDAAWNYPTELFDLIALPAKNRLAPYQPKQRFFLINEKIMKDKMKASLTRTLFKLEFIQTDQDFEQFFSEFPAFLRRMAPNRQDELARVFSAYVGGVFSENGQEVPDSFTDQLLGSKRMLAKNLKKILEDKEQVGITKGKQMGITEGKQIGITEGKQIGITEGKLEKSRATLKNLLQKKFNVVLSDAIHQKIEAADIDTLDLWIENIFDAKSIEGLLRLTC